MRVHLNFLPIRSGCVCVLKIAFKFICGTCDENHSHMCACDGANNRIRCVHLSDNGAWQSNGNAFFCCSTKNWIEKYYHHHHHQWENEHCFICCVWILLAHTLRSVRVKVSRCVTVVICCRLRRRRHFAVLIIHAQHNEPHSTFGFRIHACAHIWQAVRQHTQTKMSKTFTISSHWKKLLRTWFSYGF